VLSYRMSTMATLMLLTGCGAADTGKTPDKNTGKTSVSAPPINYGTATFTLAKPFTTNAVAAFESP